MQANIVDLTPENFQQVLLEQSMQQTVLVQLWSPQSEACLALTPLLEQAASQHAAHLLLARVNCDEQPQLAMQFRVQSVPMLLVFQQGQPVDAVGGPMDAAQLQEFLSKHLPSEQDLLLQQAQQQLVEGNANGAIGLLQQAITLDEKRADIRKQLVAALLEGGRLPEAEQQLQQITLADQDADYQSLIAQLELKQQASDTPEIRVLQDKLEQQPEEPQLSHELALALHAVDRHEEALELLIQLLRKDINLLDGQLKKSYLDIIKAMPDGDPIASKYRRYVFSLMY